MTNKKGKYNAKKIKAAVFYEIFGFFIVIVFLWIDEILDLPHHLFKAMETPVNVVESLFESIIILFICIFCVKVTMELLSKIRILEGMLPICASCKKIRDEHNEWQSLETFFEKRSHVSFTHGLCKDCMDKMYGNQDWYKKK